MKILYVVSRPLEINTSASIRNRATIKGLLDLGHSVDLVTTQFDKNHTNFDEGLLNKDLHVTYLKIGGIQQLARIGRKHRIIRPMKKYVYRIMSMFEIYDNLKGIVKYADQLNINDSMYDMIISSSDPKSSHLFVHRMFEKGVIKRIPWIQIWGDPFLSDITRNNTFLNAKIKKEENKLLKYAKKVIYVSNLTLKEQQKVYPHYASKMFYEPVPYVKRELYSDLDDIKTKKTLTFLYCGDYSSNVRNIKPLYKAIKNTNHNLIICGNSDLNLESTDRIKIYRRVSFEETKDFEKNCDVLVHLSNLRGTQIPGKIYHYSGTNKLILFILDGNESLIRKSFEKYKRYIFSRNMNEDIERVIEQISKGQFDKTRFVVEEFCPKTIAERIINIF